MKILLLQLPVPSSDFSYAYEHVPLACGYLCASVRHGKPHLLCHILDHEICSYGSDSMIINSILDYDPDLIGFSCYLWNIERTLYIARKLREKGCGATIVVGGPEITEDNIWLMSNNVPDIYIIGEGEHIFTNLLADLKNLRIKRGTVVKTQNRLDLQTVFSPYFSGVLNPSNANTILLEGSRGCLYTCSYCYYHKSAKGIRNFDANWIIRHFEWSIEQKIKEIIFIDPSFLARPDIDSLLKAISTMNKERKIELFAEINAEHCNKKRAKLLAEAGFVQVEVGLQSTNPVVLRNINRSYNIKKFVEGAKWLRNNDIKVTLDLIVGLPGDNLESIIRSIDFVVENGLCDELNLYPLSILPGTEIRKKAEKLGLKYMKRPPYYAFETKDMKTEDIRKAFQYAEETSGFDFFPPEIPVSLQKVIPLTSCIELTEVANLKNYQIQNLANVLTIKLNSLSWLDETSSLKKFAASVIEENPFIHLNWVIPLEFTLPNSIGLNKLQSLYVNRDHPSDREFFSTKSIINSVQVFVTKENNLWIWIPPDGDNSEFRLIPHNTSPEELGILEDEVRKLISAWTNSQTVSYKITEVLG